MSPLGIAIAGIVIGIALWGIGKVMVWVGENMERWADRR